MGEGPIPWTAICQYAHAHGIFDSDELDRMSAIIKRMDIAYLTYRQKDKPGDKKIGKKNGETGDAKAMRIRNK